MINLMFWRSVKLHLKKIKCINIEFPAKSNLTAIIKALLIIILSLRLQIGMKLGDAFERRYFMQFKYIRGKYTLDV